MDNIKLILKFGMGDALNARSFIINYCNQKKIERNQIDIYTNRHKILFENDGFNIKDIDDKIKKLIGKDYLYFPNIGYANIPKVKKDLIHWDNNIAINTGIEFNFNMITPLNWKSESIDNLELPEKFITINYGYDGGAQDGKICAKLWPLEYWQELVKLIKIPCIQIGAGNKCKIIKGSSLNLVDKLSIKQSAEVMKRALFHIDTEGGLTILNHHLGGKTVVLFGPTAIITVGRSENLNLIKNTCSKCPCEPRDINGISLDHSIYMDPDNLTCSLQCMKELTPNYVISQIEKAGWL